MRVRTFSRQMKDSQSETVAACRAFLGSFYNYFPTCSTESTTLQLTLQLYN